MTGLRVLVASKSMQVTATAIGVAYVGFGATELAPLKFATIPMMLLLAAAGLTTMPASLLMAKLGRGPIFAGGAALGALGAGIIAQAFPSGSFGLLCAGSMLLGVYQATAQYYTFGAAECVDENDRTNAILYVTGSGVVAAFLAPFAAIWSEGLFRNFVVGPFVVLALALSANAAVLACWRGRQPLSTTVGRSASSIVRDPKFQVAAALSAGSFMIMTLLMTATPVMAAVCGLSATASAHIIQWHLIAMFLPPLLVRHLNVPKTPGILVTLGVSSFVCSIVVLALPKNDLQLSFGLVLLGLGWSLTYVGASTLLIASLPREDQAKAQGMSELFVWAAAALASGSSGFIFAFKGWFALLLCAMIMLGAIPLAFALQTNMRLPRRKTRQSWL